MASFEQLLDDCLTSSPDHSTSTAHVPNLNVNELLEFFDTQTNEDSAHNDDFSNLTTPEDAQTAPSNQVENIVYIQDDPSAIFLKNCKDELIDVDPFEEITDDLNDSTFTKPNNSACISSIGVNVNCSDVNSTCDDTGRFSPSHTLKHQDFASTLLQNLLNSSDCNSSSVSDSMTNCKNAFSKQNCNNMDNKVALPSSIGESSTVSDGKYQSFLSKDDSNSFISGDLDWIPSEAQESSSFSSDYIEPFDNNVTPNMFTTDAIQSQSVTNTITYNSTGPSCSNSEICSDPPVGCITTSNGRNLTIDNDDESSKSAISRLSNSSTPEPLNLPAGIVLKNLKTVVEFVIVIERQFSIAITYMYKRCFPLNSMALLNIALQIARQKSFFVSNSLRQEIIKSSWLDMICNMNSKLQSMISDFTQVSNSSKERQLSRMLNWLKCFTLMKCRAVYCVSLINLDDFSVAEANLQGKKMCAVCCISAHGAVLPPLSHFASNSQSTPYMNSMLFCQWLKFFIKNVKPAPGETILLLVDSDVISLQNIQVIQTAKNAKIEICALISSAINPLNIYVFPKFIKEVYTAVEREKDKGTINKEKPLTLPKIGTILNSAFAKVVHPTTSRLSFQKYGLYPYSKDMCLAALILGGKCIVKKRTSDESSSSNNKLPHSFIESQTLPQSVSFKGRCNILRTNNVFPKTQQTSTMNTNSVLRSSTNESTEKHIKQFSSTGVTTTCSPESSIGKLSYSQFSGNNANKMVSNQSLPQGIVNTNKPIMESCYSNKLPTRVIINPKNKINDSPVNRNSSHTFPTTSTSINPHLIKTADFARLVPGTTFTSGNKTYMVKPVDKNVSSKTLIKIPVSLMTKLPRYAKNTIIISNANRVGPTENKCKKYIFIKNDVSVENKTTKNISPVKGLTSGDLTSELVNEKTVNSNIKTKIPIQIKHDFDSVSENVSLKLSSNAGSDMAHVKTEVSSPSIYSKEISMELLTNAVEPCKHQTLDSNSCSPSAAQKADVLPVQKRRGRPPKPRSETEVLLVRKPRGRPPKPRSKTENLNNSMETTPSTRNPSSKRLLDDQTLNNGKGKKIKEDETGVGNSSTSVSCGNGKIGKRSLPIRSVGADATCPMCMEDTEDPWIQCMKCSQWVHELCANINDPLYYYCDFCEKS